uniref:RING-type domain-containing protein n=1 Tax=Strongyloides papillosus TaxID=174720 RepID=A0A0N5C7V4_STREA
MSEKKIISNPAPHSALEELCFKHFKIAHQECREVNYDNIATEAMVINNKLKTTEATKFANLLIESTIEDTNNHEKERYQKYCKIMNIPDKCVDFFNEHNVTDDHIEENVKVNYRTLSRKEHKRPFSAISQNMDNIDSSDSEYDSENDINCDRNSDISFVSEQFSILEVESINDMEEDSDFECDEEFEDESGNESEFENESDSDKNKFIVWHPTKSARNIIIKNIPESASEIYNQTVININWKSLIKQSYELDSETPSNYVVFKRIVYKVWEEELERVNKEKDSMIKKISFDVDGYRHLKDNGSEIIGLISKRHYNEQIIKKVDVLAESIDTNVYIYKFQKEIVKDNVTMHYYRCKSCKEIEDKLAQARKKGIQINDADANEKSATLIRKYNNETLIEENSGFNKFHRKHCRPYTMYKVLADQFAKKVKEIVSTGLTNFDSAYEIMRYSSICLATLHNTQYHNIMVEVLKITTLREECQRINEFKSKNRIEFIESIKYTINSENNTKEKLLRYKKDSVSNMGLKDIIVENDYMIFAAPLQYIMSAECDIWMADGCHSLLDRKQYEQVYTIHDNFKKVDRNNKYIFKNWLTSAEQRKLICKFGKDIRTTNVCESFHTVCKLKGCSDVYTVERSFKNIRILFDNIEIELKRLHMSNRDLPNQKLKYRFRNTDNCIKFLDEIGSKIFVEKVVADEFGNYRHEGIQEICQERKHIWKKVMLDMEKTLSLHLLKKS